MENNNNMPFTESDDGGNLAEIAKPENPAQSLADMPSFEKFRAGIKAAQEKSFTDAKQDGELPEGIRDESDYQEYMAEQKARAKEHETLDDKLFEDIKSIEDPNNRDLVTAILPFYYSNLIQRPSADKTNIMHAAARDAMQAVIGCMKGDNNDPYSIDKALYKTSKKYIDKDINAANYIDSIATNGLGISPNFLKELKDGQKTENMNLSEANFNVGNRPNLCEFVIKIGKGDTQNMIFRTEGLSSAKEQQRSATKVVLSMADNLARKINEVDDFEKSYDDRNEMSTLWEISWTADGDIEKALAQHKEQKLNNFISSIKDRMDSANFDRHNSNISFDNNKLISLVSAKELSDEFTEQKEFHLMYNRALKLGKKILSGENWQNINANNIYYESEE